MITPSHLTPVGRFVAKFGMLPSSYKEAMTYEEQLVWLCNYLETEILPAINNNADGLTELQNLFVALKDYVDNYFDNLDIQAEVNAKIEDMVDSGEMQEIVTAYLEIKGVLGFNTVADMKAGTNFIDGSIARTLGKTTYNDKQGSFYYIRDLKNTDVIDEINILAITNYPDLVAEKIGDKEIEDLQNEVVFIKSVIKNVKNYGAKGDGETDDTNAIVAAINDLEDGDTLLFPAGDYIVYNDYEQSTTNPCYPVEKLIRLYQKKNITITGQGAASTRLRPSNQGRVGTKYYYPCTLSIQECEDIIVKDICIESKGENYGDHDDQGSVTTGSERALAMADNGGSALFIALSKRIEVFNCQFRYAGSCSSVYFTSFEDCNIHDCFVNVASLGYACITFDNYTGLGTSYNETGIVRDCIAHKETNYRPEDGTTQICSNVYCAKGGVCIEGSTTNTFHVDVIGCKFSDMYSGGTSTSGHNEGYGITNYYSTGTFENNIIENSNLGIKNLQLNPDSSTSYPLIINNNIIRARYTGIWLKHDGSNRAATDMSITNNNILVDENSTVPDGAPAVLQEKAAIAFSGYNSYYTKIKNNILNGNKGIYYNNQTSYAYILDNKITADVCIDGRGGGHFVIANNHIELTTNGLYLYPYDGGQAASLYVNADNNLFFARSQQANAAQIQAGSYASYINQQSFKGNKFWNCWAIHPQIKTPDTQLARLKLSSRALQGSNTLLTFNINNNYVAYTSHKILNDANNWVSFTMSTYDAAAGTVTLVTSGDVRSNFTNDNTYIVL